MTKHVWYVAYGSNLCKSRFMAYIEGSDGSIWPKARGCRDRTPPLREVSGQIPGRIYFAEHSSIWDNGGVAFYDPTVEGAITLVRMHLVTGEQFCDIFLQENGHEEGEVADIIPGLLVGVPTICGNGWYREIWRLEDVEGYPALTFTSPNRLGGANLAKPSKRYLDVIEAGLNEGHGLHEPLVSAYLARLR